MPNKYTLLLLVIISLGFLLRSLSINLYPPSLNWDEVSLGYNSYSVLKTGKDEWGATLPFIFRAYGDFKLPLYVYASIPFVLIFGLNEYSTRALSMVFGTLLIFITYLIFQLLTKDKKASIISCLVLALSTWHIFLSRIALEANVMLTLLAASIYFILRKQFNLSLILLSLSAFTYNSARVYLPIFIILIIILIRKNHLHLQRFIPGLTFTVLSLGIILIQFLYTSSGAARFNSVSIINEGSINFLNQKRGELDNNLISKLIYNKPNYFIVNSLKNYFLHFSPDYLFISGGSHYQFNIPNFPLFIVLFLPFFIIGIHELLKNKTLLLIFLVSPIPSAITRDAPHTLRSILFIYICTITICLGVSKIYKKKKYSIFSIVLLSLSLQLYIFSNAYKNYNINYAWAWQYGYKDVARHINKYQSEYDQIFITKKYGEPHGFINFYNKVDPSSFQKYKKWDYHASWFWVNEYFNIKYINDWDMISEINQNLDKNLLVITSPNNYSNGNKLLLKTIFYPNKTPVFDIVQYTR